MIQAVTKKEGCFEKTVLKFRKMKSLPKLKAATKILSTLLLHQTVDVRQVANSILRRDKKTGEFDRPTVDSIADACRVKIERHGNPIGLMLEAEPTKAGALINTTCILLKGKFHNKRTVYCRYPSVPRSIERWESTEMPQEGTHDKIRDDIRLLKHLQQQTDCENIITLLAFSADANTRLTYYLFSCDALDTTVSEYLMSHVRRVVGVPLAQRVGLAVDVLNAVNFCNRRNILIRHLCASAFLLTWKDGQVRAKLANFSQARIVKVGPSYGSSQMLLHHGR